MSLFGKRKREDINLIPEEQQVLKTQANKKGIVVFFIIIVTILFGTYGLVFALQMSVKAEGKRITSDIKKQSAAFQKEATVAASIKQIQTKYSAFKKQKTEIGLEDKLDHLANSLPSRVQITALSLDPFGKAEVAAKAFSAATAYQFIETLRAEKADFANVVLTALSQGKEGTQVTFNLTMLIQ